MGLNQGRKPKKVNCLNNPSRLCSIPVNWFEYTEDDTNRPLEHEDLALKELDHVDGLVHATRF